MAASPLDDDPLLSALLRATPPHGTARPGASDPLLAALLGDPLAAPEAPTLAVPAPILQIAPLLAQGQREADYALALHNRGDRSITVLLRADDPLGLLGYEFGQERIALEPGQSAHVPLTVEAPRRLIGPPARVAFAVFAQPEGGEPVAAEATLLHQSMLPPWLLLLLGALIVGVVLVLLTR